MILQRRERVYYVLSIGIVPDVPGTRQASFDGGETWIDGVSDGENWKWLIAGPLFDATEAGMDAADTKATIDCDTYVHVRVKESPEVEIEVAPDMIVLAD